MIFSNVDYYQESLTDTIFEIKEINAQVMNR